MDLKACAFPRKLAARFLEAGQLLSPYRAFVFLLSTA